MTLSVFYHPGDDHHVDDGQRNSVDQLSQDQRGNGFQQVAERVTECDVDIENGFAWPLVGVHPPGRSGNCAKEVQP